MLIQELAFYGEKYFWLSKYKEQNIIIVKRIFEDSPEYCEKLLTL
jgi:hypothetical protein